MQDGFEVILLEVSPEMQELAKRTRALIKKIMPDVVEVPWPKQKNVGYGVGPKKMSQHFCYIGVFKNHINLGFNYGANLPDPENLLEGTGALFRHIKITKQEQLEQTALYQLLEAATKHLPRLKKMRNRMSESNNKSFPEFVKKLPKADYSSAGAGAIRGFVVEGKNHQVVFNENDEAVEFTPHTHAASFGVVLEGECELVIEGVSKIYRAGDVYHVPEGALHFARQSANYRDIVIFDEPGRVPIIK